MRKITTDKATYAIRGPCTVKQLKQLYRSFCEKHGSKLSFDEWLVQRGKVYFRLPPPR
jgi:hypothetical protein